MSINHSSRIKQLQKGKAFLSLILAVAAFVMPSYSALAAGRTVVGYYYFWDRQSFPYSEIEYSKLNCIAYAFVIPNSDGTITTEQGASWNDFLYPQLIATAHNDYVKVVISVGGYNSVATANFSLLCKSATTRANFARTMKDFCLQNGFDGVDIDWEYPGSGDRANFVAMIQALRDSLNSTGKQLSLSITTPGYVGSGYDINSLYPLLDWVGVMTYDYHGSWTNNSGPISPLYPGDAEGSVSTSISQFLQSTSVPPSKLFMGLAFYGYDFQSKGLYQPRTGSAPSIPFRAAIDSEKAGWTYHWDDVSKTPYLTDASNTHVIPFDDTVSIRYKCDYLKSKGLGGVIIWEISQDDLGSSQPLLETTWGILNPEEAVAYPGNHAVPTYSSLLQNYPNPFNPSTTISYRLSAVSRVTLRVYDVLGQEVATLVDGRQGAGNHSVTFSAEGGFAYSGNASGLASGVYVSVLSVNGKFFTQKMLYLK